MSSLVGTFGCLPAGEPPHGRQLVADRSVSGAFFSPSGSDPAHSQLLVGGPTRTSPLMEFSGGSYTTMVSDLYRPDVSATAVLALRLDQMDPAVPNLNGAATDMLFSDLPVDSLGRLLLQTVEMDPASGRALGVLVRYDPDTRRLERLLEYDDSGTGVLTFSPGHTRALLHASPPKALLIDVDGQQELDCLSAGFVGEDLYYTAGTQAKPWEPPSKSTLMLIRPGGASEVILDREGYIFTQVVQGDNGASLLLLTAPSADATTPSTYLFDPASSAFIPLPRESADLTLDSVSPDGRLIVFRSDSEGDWMLYDRIDATTRTLPINVQRPWQPTAEWRPGTEELWLTLEDGLMVWTADRNVTVHASPGPSCLQEFRYRSSIFNSDGSLWFSATWTDDGSHMAVGFSDQPERPVMPIQPSGTWVSRCWELEGHRLLVEVRAGDSQDTDLYLADPTSGDIHPVAGSAQIVQAGKARALALLQWERWRSAGELALIDYDTGARTHLADDVAQAVVDSAGRNILSGTDTLAPGTRVAFISRNRLDSPYDGLWLTELP